ncbi:MAG TPA: amino acid adenylation domain-containing protein [Polyangiales bacterium]|nr:amino acid adenylation domain-containing protein [Polyangiales bacterium]
MPQQPIAAHPLRPARSRTADARERAQIRSWNATEVAYPHGCVPHAIEQQALRTPEACALQFDAARVSYAELNRRANRLARALRARGVGKHSLVGVAMERSLELPLALLAILKSGAAYVPFDPSLPAERFDYMREDARPHMVIADRPLHTEGVLQLTRAELQQIACDPEGNGAVLEDEVQIAPDDLAYVIYTSGSSGTPKGVANTHAGLWNRLCWMQQYLQLGERDCVLQKTPYSFDVSVWEFFWPLLTGARLLVARPEGHKDSRYLRDEIVRGGVTTLHFVPSMLEAFLSEPELAGLPLTRVICSGEALSYALQERFFERLPGVELYNLYGPTEAAIDVTAYRCAPHPRRIVPIGRPIANTQIHILDADQQPVPIGCEGELYIGGVGLARGYLNRPELTEQRFVADPFSSTPGARLYRTGDLARFDDSGEIEYLGRNDDQIKLRGFRIELGEIEAVAEQHPSVARCLVLARKTAAGGTRLHGVLLPAAGTIDVTQVRALLQRKLPEYMVPDELTQLASLPLTYSGKVDRIALLAQLEAAAPVRRADATPVSPREQILLDIWRQVLGVAELSIHDNYFALGGDSIRSLQLRALARARGIELEIPTLFAHQTIAELARVLPESTALPPERYLAPFALVSPELRGALSPDYEDAFPVTQLQLGMLYHSELSRQSLAYHDVFDFELELRDDFSAPALQDALAMIVRRHPVLRSCFDLGSYERPLQLVARDAVAPLELRDLSALGQAEIERSLAEYSARERARGYDLARAPLFRLAVHVLSQRRVHMTLSFHHAILDGWSTASLLRELLGEYTRRSGGSRLLSLPAPQHTFAEYVALEAEAAESAASRSYFLAQLEDAELTRIARWSEPRGSKQQGSGRIVVDLDADLTTRLFELAKSRGAPLKSLLLCAHARVIAAYSGQDDIVTGRVVHGRPEVADAERILGLFLNTLPTRLRLAGKTWAELASDVEEDERLAHPHRRFPLHEIARSLGRKALFETAFNFVNYHVYDALLDDGALRVTRFHAHENSALAILASFVASPRDGRLALHLEYDAEQLPAAHAQQIAQGYPRALAALAGDFDGLVSDADLLDAEQRALLLETWNDTGRAAAARPIHELVAAQVARTPDAVAVRCEGASLRYAELDRQAEALAWRILRSGAEPGEVIAICAEPSLERAVAVLAVLKAGGAYMPLDPEYPVARLELMLEQARARTALVTAAYANAPFLAGRSLIALDGSAGPGSGGDALPTVEPHNAAYVIFTSGSTGRPKGIVMQHAPLSNLIAWQIAQSPLPPGAATAQASAFSFDVSFQETFATWAAGGALVIAPERCRKDVRALARLLQSERVARLFAPVVVLHQLAEVVEQLALELPDLRELITAGEQLEITASVRAFFTRHPSCRLANHYGPTETHVATAHPLSEDPASWPVAPPIGRPLPGVRTYVLDAAQKLLPPGVPGELYLAGACVALGYCNDDALTRERFLVDPFAGAGERMYRTGDLARYRSDGTLDYLGRRDGQVKIRGYRVEIGEIEAALYALGTPRIRSALVLAVPSRSQASRLELAAYVVLEASADAALFDARAVQRALARKLPVHMVPSTINALPELPRTPSGKVDRLALQRSVASAARESSPRVLAAPASELEAELCALWREVLGAAELGVTDDFFEHGGDSLSAIRLVARVQRRYGVELPISALVEAATVRAFAEVVSGARTVAGSALVGLTPSTKARAVQAARAPLFCLHPIGGNVLCYMPLARQLGPDQRVYGLKARGLEAGEHPRKAIPELASAYTRELLAVQPEGPIHLCGWSFGGIVAVEMARQLMAAGRELAPVVVVDTMAAGRIAATVSESDVLEGFALELFGAGLEGEEWEQILSPTSPLDRETRVARLIARARTDGLVPEGVGSEQIERVFAVMRASFESFTTYEQRAFDGELILLRCQDAMPGRLRRMHDLIGSRYDDRKNGWGLYCPNVTVMPVRGDHLTIVREPHVAQIARVVRRVLDGRAIELPPAPSNQPDQPTQPME